MQNNYINIQRAATVGQNYPKVVNAAGLLPATRP